MTRGATVLLAANAHHSGVLAMVDDRVDVVRMALGYDIDFEAAHVPTAAEIGEMLSAYPQLDAVMITSPTYEGEIADVAAIADVCHAKDVLVIVDFAWGAHFAFSETLPAPPPMLGADIAITSLHKLGGAPQQTAVLLFNTDRITASEVDAAYVRVATTSPSMVLLGGIDSALREMAERGVQHIARTVAMATRFSDLVRPLDGVTLFSPPVRVRQDPTRVTLRVTGHALAGFELAAALEQRRIACEKASTMAITVLFGMGLADDAPERIAAAIREILAATPRCEVQTARPRNPFAGAGTLPVMTPGEAQRLGRTRGELVPLDAAVGRVACQLYEVYPPGIPVIVPGFVVTAGAVDVLRDALRLGGSVLSTGAFSGSVLVLSQDPIRTTNS